MMKFNNISNPIFLVNDHKNIITPHEAIKKDADFLVIGRPITRSDNPKLAAKDILFQINDI